MFKRLLIVAVLVATALTPAFARNQKRSVNIPRPFVVQGQEMPAGVYTAEFIDDQEGQLVLFDGRKELARLPYKVVTLQKAASGDVVVFNNVEGKRTISRIEFKGMTAVLQLD